MSALLTRQTRVEIQESNIAVLGRPEFGAKYQVKADNTDPAWKDVGKVGGVKMWRVEQSTLVDWPDRGPHVVRPQDRYGYFYDEDAYLILHTYTKNESGKMPFLYDVYYWIGQKATPDDTATAAYKSVELDELLGKQTVQYREAQGHESDRFLLLFPTFMVYKGGKSTKWHHPCTRLAPEVKKIYRMWTTTEKIHNEFRLYGNDKGKQTISYELSFDGLEIEQGGVYCYDSSDKIGLYCTRASYAWDRYFVGEMVMHIGYSRLGFHKNFAHWDDGTPGDHEFMELVGVDKLTPLHSRVYDRDVGSPARLYRLNQAVPHLEYSPVESPSSTLDALDSKDIYIIDDYRNAHDPVVYVWVGKDVADAKTRFALVNGEMYLKEKKGLETSQFLKALSSAALKGVDG